MAKQTLATLARELGVSRTTVSNAYNRPEQLSPELREKILDTAARLGYAGPDPTARSLRRRFTGTIGVLFTDHLTYAFDDLASVDFLAGMAEVGQERGAALTLVPAKPSGAVAPELVNSAVVDGFVVYSVAAQDPYLQAAIARQLPLVVCDQPVGTNLPFVGIDDRAAIAPAAQALVDAGHRRIGILCIRLDRKRNDGLVSEERLNGASLHVQRSRVLGALDIFRDAGITGDIPVVERHINDRQNNRDAARELLETYPDITAVLCTTDSMAFGVLDYASDHGINVPRDLSVVGFDGVSTALARNLSTVIQPNRQKGIASARALFRLIEGEVIEPETKLETTWFPGATIAAPRARLGM